MKLAEFIKEHDAQAGKVTDTAILNFAALMDQIRERFERRGREDAANGLPMPTAERFLAWSKKHIEEDREMVWAVADIMRCQYMKGYNAGKEAE